jgi:hypothetical protein
LILIRTVAVGSDGGVLRVLRGRVAWLVLGVVELVGEAWCCEGGEGLGDLGVLYVLVVDEEA